MLLPQKVILSMKYRSMQFVCISVQRDQLVKILGHFGVTKLAATVHNPYFIDEVVHFLNQICPGCLNPRENIDLKVCTFLSELSSSSLSTACFISLPKFIDAIE
jgi:hypothetical protein